MRKFSTQIPLVGLGILALLLNGLELMLMIICKVMHHHNLGYAQILFNEAPLGRILKPILDKYMNFQRDFQRDYLLQQGIVKIHVIIDI